jgi:hypothetical protein
MKFKKFIDAEIKSLSEEEVSISIASKTPEFVCQPVRRMDEETRTWQLDRLIVLAYLKFQYKLAKEKKSKKKMTSNEYDSLLFNMACEHMLRVQIGIYEGKEYGTKSLMDGFYADEQAGTIITVIYLCEVISKAEDACGPVDSFEKFKNFLRTEAGKLERFKAAHLRHIDEWAVKDKLRPAREAKEELYGNALGVILMGAVGYGIYYLFT